MTAHAKKETPAFLSRPVAAPKVSSVAMRGYGRATWKLCCLSVPKPDLQPLDWGFFVRSSRIGNNENIIAGEKKTVKFRQKAIKNPRFGKQNRIGIRRTDIQEINSHELPLVHTSEMTLDYSFLSDSRNFFV